MIIDGSCFLCYINLTRFPRELKTAKKNAAGCLRYKHVLNRNIFPSLTPSPRPPRGVPGPLLPPSPTKGRGREEGSGDPPGGLKRAESAARFWLHAVPTGGPIKPLHASEEIFLSEHFCCP